MRECDRMATGHCLPVVVVAIASVGVGVVAAAVGSVVSASIGGVVAAASVGGVVFVVRGGAAMGKCKKASTILSRTATGPSTSMKKLPHVSPSSSSSCDLPRAAAYSPNHDGCLCLDAS